MILGHAFPPVVEAIQQAAARGASFGASTAAEADLAELVTQCFPSIEKLRFVSSGTEASMSAIRLARGFTGRNFVIKFEGCYHGHSDAMLVKAGSGVATLGIPGSAGVPAETAQHTLALPFNDLAAVRGGVCGTSGRDCLRHRGAGRGQCGHDSASAGISRRSAGADAGAWRAADSR